MWEEQMARIEELMKVVEPDQLTLRLLQTHQHHQCLCKIKVPIEMTALYTYPFTGASGDAINVQVERLLKSDRDRSTLRLRDFSGKAQTSGKVDYEEWAS